MNTNKLPCVPYPEHSLKELVDEGYAALKELREQELISEETVRLIESMAEFENPPIALRWTLPQDETPTLI